MSPLSAAPALLLLLLLLYFPSCPVARVSAPARADNLSTYDVVVYGASGAACIAAIAAARSGAPSVALLSQTGHVGGMLTGGLQHTDSANDTVIQGITREFFVRTELQYPGRPTDANYPPGHNPPGWLFESHVAERVLFEMLAEANVTVVLSVGGAVSVTTSTHAAATAATAGNTGTPVALPPSSYSSASSAFSPSSSPASAPSRAVETSSFESGAVFAATVWVDASYEGGILEHVATMTWGRESAAEYGEASAGVRPAASIGATVNPYWNAHAVPYDVPSNILPHVVPDVPAAVGGGDLWSEPYDFRLCFTNSPGNRLPISRPDSYNASEWELWRRIYKVAPPSSLAAAGLACLGPIPNNYSDCGNGGCKKCDMLGMNHGTDMTGASWGYPNGTLAERAAIWRRHVEFTRGLLWFWASDPAVPASVRQEIAELGHCTDEYDANSDPPHWPHQLYVRQAKRLVGAWVWTEHAANASLAARSIGLGSYGFDSHYVSRVVARTGAAATDTVVKEGRVDVPTEQPSGPAPAPAFGLGYGCTAVGGDGAGAGYSRCIAGVGGPHGDDAACGGDCPAFAPQEWLAVQRLSTLSNRGRTLTVTPPAGEPQSTWFKRSEKLAHTLPDDLKKAVNAGQVFNLTRPADTHVGTDETYYLVALSPSASPPVPATRARGRAVDEAAGRCSVCMVAPFVMPYDAMLPLAEEVSNVLAPVAVSATHVRYNAVRMEPTWMILGHAAGAAAAAAVAAGTSVQDVNVSALQEVLLEQKQLISPTQGLPPNHTVLPP